MADFQFAWFANTIQDPDPAEKNSTYSALIPQVYSNSAALVANASELVGLRIALAASVSVVEGDRIGLDSSRTLSYAYPPNVSDYTISGATHDTGGRFKQTVAGYYVDQSLLRRVFLLQDGAIGTGDQGTVTFGPNSEWARHSTVDHTHIGMNRYGNNTIELRFDEAFQRPA